MNREISSQLTDLSSGSKAEKQILAHAMYDYNLFCFIESLEALSNTSPKHSDEEGEFDNDRGLQENRNSPQR